MGDFTNNINSFSDTVLYLLKTSIVLWPEAAMIRKKSWPWRRQLLMQVCRRSWKVKFSIPAFLQADLKDLLISPKGTPSINGLGHGLQHLYNFTME